MILNTSLINWQKVDGLLPVIVQHAQTGQVLMLGYMNDEALAKTINEGKVTFYSRTKQRLWTKGETSGHFLNVMDMSLDCDNDTLLILANPIGAPAIPEKRAAFISSPNKPPAIGHGSPNRSSI